MVRIQTWGYSAGFREGQRCIRAEEETLEFSFGVVLGSFSVQSDGRYQQDAPALSELVTDYF